ncbi:MAG: FKBP-type peptidyl-prolyl cis-trans isomerase [Actinomycetota bacterium]
MRRTLPLAVAAVLLVAACGSDDDSSTDATDNNATTETATTDQADDAAGQEGTDDTTPTGPECIETGGTLPEPDFGDAGPPPTSPDKPEVDIPSELPTELEVNLLTEGTGPAAEEGDTVIVDYIGVRSRDGLEFDNSYDREPFPVVLGTQSVIPGWEQGLVGVSAGDQVQLDIPSDLAYGETARSEVICENEDLTFVVDVRAVVKPADPADEPVDAGVDASEGATEVTTVDLREGDGATLEAGQTAVVHLVLFRGDTLVALDTTWASEALSIPMVEGQTIPGLIEGAVGMQVGGRRAIVIPPDDAFGPEGNPQLGLPEGTDTVIVVDLLGVY